MMCNDPWVMTHSSLVSWKFQVEDKVGRMTRRQKRTLSAQYLCIWPCFASRLMWLIKIYLENMIPLVFQSASLGLAPFRWILRECSGRWSRNNYYDYCAVPLYKVSFRFTCAISALNSELVNFSFEWFGKCLASIWLLFDYSCLVGMVKI